MRLIKTQANRSRQRFKQAEMLINTRIKTKSYVGLRNALIMLLGPVPQEALELVRELAYYEANFMNRKIKQHINPKAVKLSKSEIDRTIDVTKVAVALSKLSQTIKDTYTEFRDKKINQYLRVIQDANIVNEDPQVTVEKITNITNGLITVQNLAIAGVAVIATVNAIRHATAKRNRITVEWSAILDEATCAFCEEQDGTQYTSEEDSPYEIPAHARCRCTWLLVR